MLEAASPLAGRPTLSTDSGLVQTANESAVKVACGSAELLPLNHAVLPNQTAHRPALGVACGSVDVLPLDHAVLLIGGWSWSTPAMMKMSPLKELQVLCMCNTWPLMHGQFLADAATMMSPFWHNFIENGVMIQFVHRWLGAILLLGVVVLLVFSLKERVLVKPAMTLACITAVQFVLGVLTLLQSVPVFLGSAHQAVACLMLLALTWLIYVAREPEED